MLLKRLTPEEICGVYGLETFVLMVDEDNYAVSGFRREGERLWAYLDMTGTVPALPLLRVMKRILAHKTEEVSVVCEKHKYPQAPKLLTLLGFKAIDEMQYGMRVWTWQRSR